MEKIQFYRTAIDACGFLVDFMTKENFYDSEFHKDLSLWCERVTNHVADMIIENVSPKIAK